jgi:hypothetical protein
MVDHCNGMDKKLFGTWVFLRIRLCILMEYRLAELELPYGARNCTHVKFSQADVAEQSNAVYFSNLCGMLTAPSWPLRAQ